jgi:class 3 adenylate cyclase
MRAHAYRVRELLELGDIEEVDRELAQYAQLAEELRMPHHLWHVPAMRAMRALMDGELEEAERLAERARIEGERAEQPLANQFFAVQTALLRRLRGTIGELLPVIRELGDRYPAIPAWRSALINFAAVAGDHEQAAAELERLAADDFSAVPRDINWLAGMGLLGEAVALLEDTERAAALYEALLPYEGLVIVAARAAASNGPVARTLGLLSGALGRFDDAERHLSRAIDASKRMGDRPFAAIAQGDLAKYLLRRDAPGDRERALDLLGASIETAREIGARGIGEPALALRLEAQGLAGIDVTTSIDDVVSAVESERPDLRVHAAPDGTVTILFSDIENSTEITERLGDQRWLEELRAHNAVFREQLARHGGYEVKNQGDGFMLAFPDPGGALGCAIAVQRAFAQRAEEGSGEPLRVRMGLHTGEVIAEEGDFFGKNVILAARIAARALGGEILVSSKLRDAAEEGDGLRFDRGREVELKGLAGTHVVYRAEWEPQTAAA